MKRAKAFTIVLFLSSSLLGSAVGKITALSGEATLSRSTKNLPAALGTNLEIKDTIATAKNSKAQLTFKDNTIITVGKQTVFSVEEYLNDTSANSDAKFNVVTGTIRAMSGKIGKIAPDKFKVKTKTATIGIRGTDFIVQVLPTGELVVLCLQGTITVTPPNSTKTIVVPAGSFVTITTFKAAPDGLSSTSSSNTVVSAGSDTTSSVNIVISEVREFTAIELNQILKEGLFLPALLALQDKNVIVNALDKVFEEMSSPEMLTLLTTPLQTIDPMVIATQTGTILVTDTQATPSALPQNFVGYTVGGFKNTANNLYTIASTGSSNFISDPRSSTVAGSIKLGNYWEGSVSSGDSYSAVDQFSAKIVSFKNDSTSYPIASGATSYIQTVSDPSDDYFAYGFWQINPMTVGSNGTVLLAGNYDAGGYWAAGVQTPSDVINGFASTMTYNGTVVGDVALLNATGTTVISFSQISSGATATMNVNFSNDTLIYNMNNFTTVAGDLYVLKNNAGSVTGNQIYANTPSGSIADFTKNGTEITNRSVSIQGGFYGPDGKIVGGTFSAGGTLGVNNRIAIQGAFKATAP
jgi:hypothetical protein